MANKYEVRRRALKGSSQRGDNDSEAHHDSRTGRLSAHGYTPPPRMDRRGLTVTLCYGLVLLITLLYVQTANHQFIVCDDDVYIYDVDKTPQTKSGLAWENVKWAFQDAHRGNWHPLTWLSHMIDWEVFSRGWDPINRRYLDSWPGGHHLVSMGIHCANAVLLFLVVRLMTGTLWPSFVVAALFAVHPLRVESVAWAAERKDVLCGLFWMATMLSYALYVRRRPLAQSTSAQAAGTIGLYLLVVVFMACGLMSKSMIVTLPCVLLLLDVWPLGRWKAALWPAGKRNGDPNFARASLLLLEKAPLLLLVYLDCRMTVYGQDKGVALTPLSGLPLGPRILNVIESTGEYLRQFFWPTGLKPFYPHPYIIDRWPTEFWVKLGIYSVLLPAITLAALWFWRRRPFLIVGWLWFLGALMPVNGLVQVGTQARADRYTYLPMIGVYLMIAWLLKEAAERWPRCRPAMAGGGLAVLLVLSVLTFRQTSYWINSYALFNHAIGVKEEDYFGYDKEHNVDIDKAMAIAKVEDNYFAFNHIGIAYDKDGSALTATDPRNAQKLLDHSAAAFAAAIGIKPNYDFGNNNLGVYYAKRKQAGDAERAERFFTDAIRYNSRYADAYNNLGSIRYSQAMALLTQNGRVPQRELKELQPEELDKMYALLTSGIPEGEIMRVMFDPNVPLKTKVASAINLQIACIATRGDKNAADFNLLSKTYLTIAQIHALRAERARGAADKNRAADESQHHDDAMENAAKWCDIALKINDGFAPAYITKAEICQERKEPDKIDENLQTAVEIDPRSGPAIEALQKLLNRHAHEPEKAVECLDKTAARFTQFVADRPLGLDLLPMPSVLAQGYFQFKQPEKSAQWLDQWNDYIGKLFSDPSAVRASARFRLESAEIAFRTNQPDRALAVLAPLLATDPPIAEAWLMEGLAYGGKGNWQKAHDCLVRAAQIAPHNPQILDRLQFVEQHMAAQHP